MRSSRKWKAEIRRELFWSFQDMVLALFGRMSLKKR
jgi:hypothetical protein